MSGRRIGQGLLGLLALCVLLPMGASALQPKVVFIEDFGYIG